MNEFRDEVFFSNNRTYYGSPPDVTQWSDLHASAFYHIVRSITGALSVGKSAVKPHRQNIEQRIKL